MNHKQRYCMRHGHDWAYNFSDNQGWILAHCLVCEAEQMFFLNEDSYHVPKLDDDGPEEPDE